MEEESGGFTADVSEADVLPPASWSRFWASIACGGGAA